MQKAKIREEKGEAVKKRVTKKSYQRSELRGVLEPQLLPHVLVRSLAELIKHVVAALPLQLPGHPGFLQKVSGNPAAGDNAAGVQHDLFFFVVAVGIVEKSTLNRLNSAA